MPPIEMRIRSARFASASMFGWARSSLSPADSSPSMPRFSTVTWRCPARSSSTTRPTYPPPAASPRPRVSGVADRQNEKSCEGIAAGAEAVPRLRSPGSSRRRRRTPPPGPPRADRPRPAERFSRNARPFSASIPVDGGPRRFAPDQAVRESHRCRRRVVRAFGRRGLRVSRPQWRRKDHHDSDADRPDPARRRAPSRSADSTSAASSSAPSRTSARSSNRPTSTAS